MRLLIKCAVKAGVMLFILFIASQYAYSQKGITVRGSVYDQNDQPVHGATIALGARTTATGADGRFSFSNVGSGERILRATAIGYRNYRDTILIGNDDLTLSIRLSGEDRFLDQVIVSGKSATQEVREQPVRAVVIDTRAAAQQPATLAELMNRAPGIRIRQSGGLGNAVDVSINGFQGNSVQYFRDGIPLDYLGGGYAINNVPLNLLERVEVYKGVVPVSLGADALGGAVNLVSAQASGTQLSASYEIASFNTYLANLSFYYTDSKNRQFAGFDAFYNDAANDYKADVEITNANANYDTVTVRLFHNAYRHHFGEIYFGVKNRSWADEIRLSLAAYGIDRDSQHPALMTNPYGAVSLENKGIVPALRYKKAFFANKLSLDQFMSYSFLQRNRTDTVRGTYDWYGRFTPRSTDEIGESPNPSLSDIDFRNITSRSYIAYGINEHHLLALNVVYNRNRRIGSDPYGFHFEGTDIDILSKEAVYEKVIAGMSWESKWPGEKLSNQFFVKYFNFKSRGINAFLANNTNLDKYTTAKDDNWGIGNAVKYELDDHNMVRASAELANRLPLTEELFGNNDTRAPNFDLEPERSFNINLGYRYSKNKVTAEVGAFYRKTRGMIMLVPIQAPFSQYQNLDSIRGYGFDADLAYRIHKKIDLTGNLTWQDNRMVDVGAAVYKWTEGTRQRNTPYFFANLGLTGRFDGVLGAKNVLKPYIYYNFIREFYLVPVPRDKEPGGFLGLFGDSQVPIKDLVPNQSLVSAGFNYMITGTHFTIGAEMKNITDARLYDYYKIQRPGRSIHFKINYHIKSIKNQQYEEGKVL